MRRFILCFVGVALLIAGGRAAFRASAPEPPVPPHFVPAGSLLYLQSADFAGLLKEWNSSPVKSTWLRTASYSEFSNSSLLMRLQQAGGEFASAAGIPPDAKFLQQVAGGASVLALYDIGKLEFVYITRLPSAQSAETSLWQQRSKFESRSAGGVTFYVRRDEEHDRVVAFAVSGDYLLLATREDLMASALELIAGGSGRSLDNDEWWAKSVAAAGAPGDLRMVLNLEKIVPTPYFRTYWIQRNVASMKQYSAAIADLYRTGTEYREERILFRKTPAAADAAANPGAAAVADLARLVPAGSGYYEVQADPSAADCLALLETKLLAPRAESAAVSRFAPPPPDATANPGELTDFETRIDEPSQVGVSGSDAAAPLKQLLSAASVRAVLRVQSSETSADGVFVRFHTAIALASDSPWDQAQVRAALAAFLRPALTAGELGAEWQTVADGVSRLDGLLPLAVAVRGKYLVVSDTADAARALLDNVKQPVSAQPAVLVAGFDHERERAPFVRLTSLLDRSLNSPGHGPAFFSGNLAGLSKALSGVSSEQIVVRDAGAKVTQTVTYRWSR